MPRRRLELPPAASDGVALRANQTAPTVTWIGHATLLIQLAGVNILTDPQWSERASPLSFAGPKRVTPPGVHFEDLPPIHVVVISHDHYDHLDEATVKRLAETHRPRFYVPLGLRALVCRPGHHRRRRARLVGQPPGARGHADLRARAALDGALVLRDEPPALERLDGGRATIVASSSRGDTGYYAPYFKEIGERLGPFDLAALSIGAYEPPAIMRLTHTTPEEALQIFADIRGRRFFAMHWGTFDLAEEPLGEPPVRLRAEAERLGLDPEHHLDLHARRDARLVARGPHSACSSSPFR